MPTVTRAQLVESESPRGGWFLSSARLAVCAQLGVPPTCFAKAVANLSSTGTDPESSPLTTAWSQRSFFASVSEVSSRCSISVSNVSPGLENQSGRADEAGIKFAQRL
jgi:hypothetical protein